MIGVSAPSSVQRRNSSLVAADAGPVLHPQHARRDLRARRSERFRLEAMTGEVVDAESLDVPRRDLDPRCSTSDVRDRGVDRDGRPFERFRLGNPDTSNAITRQFHLGDLERTAFSVDPDRDAAQVRPEPALEIARVRRWARNRDVQDLARIRGRRHRFRNGCSGKNAPGRDLRERQKIVHDPERRPRACGLLSTPGPRARIATAGVVQALALRDGRFDGASRRSRVAIPGSRTDMSSIPDARSRDEANRLFTLRTSDSEATRARIPCRSWLAGVVGSALDGAPYRWAPLLLSIGSMEPRSSATHAAQLDVSRCRRERLGTRVT